MTQKQQTPIDPNRILNINVGVLGHVDSGKTSLVKTLSTLLSTASLDKSAQSRQRGITLDLGFSAFLLPKLPPSFEKVYGDDYDMLQVTLVDCPGHASLIRTIIGGAQIIDMVLLVIDATKGIQTQTAECIVIAEMTAPNLIVALNKIDLFEPEERNECIGKVQKRIEAVLKQTRFKNAKMVPISAAVGGEKVAAVISEREKSNNHNNNKNNNNKIIGEGTTNNTLPTDNIQGLLDIITTEIVPPNDRKLVLLQKQKNKFHFSVDHCFPIKGQGTVVTGTCLSGFCEINDMIEFPHLGLERKVKSMQMFRRTVKQIKQGDRAGICLANLDPNLMERGVASSPGAVKLIDAAIAVVKKVQYFKGKCLSGGKFHVSVGHSTVMATVSFWGAKELQQKLALTLKEDKETKNDDEKNDDVELGSSSLGGSADIAGLPHIEFDFNDDFIQQDEMVESLSDIDDDPTCSSETNNHNSDSSQSPLQWAMLNFQTPVYCPLNSLIIGSRLDADVQANHCRLAFSGRLVQKCKPNQVDMARVKIYNQKERVGTVCRLGEAYKRNSDNKILRYDIYGQDLFKKETSMSQFIGLKLITKDGEIGVIQSSFGTSGKFKVHFPAGTVAREGDKLFLKFKRYLNDKDKKMHQGDELALPKEVSYEKIQTSTTKAPNKNKKNRNNKKTNDANNNNSTSISNGKPEAIQHSDPNNKNNTFSSSSSSAAAVAVAHGEIVSLKSSDILENGKHGVVIVAGFFTPDVNVREKIGWKVVILDGDELYQEEGVIAGSFGKAGKCKVSFSPNGVTENSVGKKVALFPPSTTSASSSV